MKEEQELKCKIQYFYTIGRKQYTRDKNDNLIYLGRHKKPKGVLLAIEHPDEPNAILIGWSMCSKLDRFDREIGFNLAFNRAVIWFYKYGREDAHIPLSKIPYSMYPDFLSFVDRMRRYFKGKDFPEWCIKEIKFVDDVDDLGKVPMIFSEAIQ